ncbi:hypothetical protein ACVW07_003300 [Cellulomonas sp. URHB0016]
MTRGTAFEGVRDGRPSAVARRLRRASWGLAAAAVLGLAACSSGGSDQPTPTDVTARASTGVDKSGVPAPVVPPTWPLTGVLGDPVARPALAVKIENTAVARPQTGLEQTDVVWETIVEFDVSRFIAVFHSQVPAEVGPIRSVRPMDPVILAPMHGLLAFSGGQPGILDLVAASGVQMISHDAGAPGMYRTKDRSAPHNVYGTPQTFWDQADADHQAPPAEQFLFARSADQAAAVLAGTPAGTLSFHLSPASNPAWTWDAASGTWLRSEAAVPGDGPQRRAARGGQRRVDHRGPPDHGVRRPGRYAGADLQPRRCGGRRRRDRRQDDRGALAEGLAGRADAAVPGRREPGEPGAREHLGGAGARGGRVAHDRLTPA